VADGASGAEQTLVRREVSDCLGRYIARLPASYRSVLILSEQEGLTNQKIADALGVTVDTVKIRLHRARARLRKELGSGCALYRDERNELACKPKPGGVSPRDRPPSIPPEEATRAIRPAPSPLGDAFRGLAIRCPHGPPTIS
jgi:hypothetical protein